MRRRGRGRVRVSNNCEQRRGKASQMRRHLKWAGKRVKCNGSQFVASYYKGDVLRLRIQFSWHSWQSKESEGWRGDELVSVRSKMNQLLIAEYLTDCGCICARLKIKKWQKKKEISIASGKQVQHQHHHRHFWPLFLSLCRSRLADKQTWILFLALDSDKCQQEEQEERLCKTETKRNEPQPSEDSETARQRAKDIRAIEA